LLLLLLLKETKKQPRKERLRCESRRLCGSERPVRWKI